MPSLNIVSSLSISSMRENGSPFTVANRANDASFDDQRLVRSRRRARTVTHARVGQREERRVDTHELPHLGRAGRRGLGE